MRRCAQVFEHGTLVVGDQGLTPRHFDALVKYNERHGGLFFGVGHKRLHFGSYVGLLQVGGLAIEILPKAERGAEADKRKWRDALLAMLQRSGLLNVESAPEADLHLRRAPLVDLYLETFLREAEILVHAGLARKYRVSEGNLHKLKGRILFRQHVSRNLLHKERIYTAHQVYDRDNRFNQILKRALDIVATLEVRPELGAHARRLTLSFEDVSDSRIDAASFERLVFDRSTERYRRAVKLAKLIILNYMPDLRGGSEQVLAILFDMNVLFERFVLIQMKRAVRLFRDHNLRIEGQTRRPLWGTRGIRPDIEATLELGGVRKRVILDTKWKMPVNGIPSDDDLRQMFAYNIHFGGRRGVLLYPLASRDQARVGHNFAPSRAVAPEFAHNCSTFYVDMFDANQCLRKDIGAQIIQQAVIHG